MHDGFVGGTHHGYYKPPHKHFQAVPVGIPYTGDGFHVRKRYRAYLIILFNAVQVIGPTS